MGRNGTQTATNPIKNRQHNGRYSMQRKDTTITKKSNGYAIPLAQRQRMPKKLEYIGDQENQNTQTTGLSTIHKHTTETQDKNS